MTPGYQAVWLPPAGCIFATVCQGWYVSHPGGAVNVTVKFLMYFSVYGVLGPAGDAAGAGELAAGAAGAGVVFGAAAG
jgi:hypothetical protein